MDPATVSTTMSLMQNFAEYGGILGLMVGVLLIQLIYMQFTMSKRLTDLTDRILNIVEKNTLTNAQLKDTTNQLVNAMDKRRCLAPENLSAQVRASEKAA